MKQLGLIGKNISHSFSKKFFAHKFEIENIKDFCYEAYDIPEIEKIEEIFATPNLVGLNVTIPYKQKVIAFLDNLSAEAKEIGAVNTIKIINKQKIGYNTDCYGFENSLLPLINANHTHALILGTGGASKAILYVLNKLNIKSTIVSRQKTSSTIIYEELTQTIFEQHKIIINCTPLGTYPNIEDCPIIPYHFFSKEHLAYDLIYNPTKTTFLLEAEKKGAAIKNGLEMLELQAKKAWEIWIE